MPHCPLKGIQVHWKVVAGSPSLAQNAWIFFSTTCCSVSNINTSINPIPYDDSGGRSRLKKIITLFHFRPIRSTFLRTRNGGTKAHARQKAPPRINPITCPNVWLRLNSANPNTGRKKKTMLNGR